MVSLASRSCQLKHQTPLDSTKKSESSARKMVTSQKSQTPLDSAKKGESSVRKIVTSQKSQLPKSISTTAKTLTGSSSRIYEKKAAVAKSAMKGRSVVNCYMYFIRLNSFLFLLLSVCGYLIFSPF